MNIEILPFMVALIVLAIPVLLNIIMIKKEEQQKRKQLYTIKTKWGTYNDIEVRKKRNADDGALVVLLYSLEEGLFAYITVNIDESKTLGRDEAFVDVDSYPWAPEFIKENRLGYPTGKSVTSEFCDYPVFKFYTEKFND